jgi:ribosomal protein RSM22 (predicted rRNA methylase)
MSYIVVKKAERDKNGKNIKVFSFIIIIIIFVKDIYGTWPRVIEPIIDRKNHQHVRLCCPNGEYVNVPISKNKHGTYVFLIFCFFV